VISVQAAGTAVLTDDEFLGSVGLVTFGDIVEMPAFGAL